jgi:hypothetical protein
LLISAASVLLNANADSSVSYEAETYVNAGKGDLAPYFITSNNGGVVTQPFTLMERAKLEKELVADDRFEYGFGIDAIANASKSVNYNRYSADKGWIENMQHPSRVWLQQLWAGLKYRGVFLTAGMSENNRSLFDNNLGSGDITLSNNARPIPQIRIGFIDFQDVPLTNGWLQIQGEIAYGKFFDKSWLENHYNYYNSKLTTGLWFHYKRAYFRTNPDMPFCFTIGMQHASQFGGSYRSYKEGNLQSENSNKVKLKDFVDVFIQKNGGSGSSIGDKQYYNGNHLGSWDMQLSYMFEDGAEFKFTLQSPWEDGSGIGKLNGWDGVYGLEYNSAYDGAVEAVRIEYFDFRNQSGPIHWAPADSPNTQIPNEATGADDYYNNYYYNGWMNYGMALGSPLMLSPIYNTDGTLHFLHNRIRGFQVGMSGHLSYSLPYRVLLNSRKSWGTPFIPLLETKSSVSMMLELGYDFSKIPLSLTAQIAFDSGKLYGNNFGASLSVVYYGEFMLKKRGR